MASSQLMATTTTATNSDLQPQQSAICSLTIADLQSDHQTNKNFGSMSMEDLLKNIYSDSPLSPDSSFPPPSSSAAVGDGVGGVTTGMSRQGSFSLPKNVVNRTVDEVWKEIVAGGSVRTRGGLGEGGGGGGGGGGMMEEMTLEDFLTKAGAVREDEVRAVPLMASLGGYGVDSLIMNGDDGGGGGAQFQHQNQMQTQNVDGSMMGFGNGIDGRVLVNSGGGGGGGRGGRNKRRAVEETVDKATQQKQRRMIKNRESAARSRERKQAYAVELESLVTQLEEENARLRREEAEESKERLKRLMENLIPVVEKRKEPRILRRIQSMEW